jgi:adenylosuccinate synthase
MPLHIVVGTQWGDEGKGRITDLLAAEAQVAARYSGGDNAGHTVTVSGPQGSRVFKLHLLPSGLVQPNVTGVLGHGMVVNPASLLAEMNTLAEAGLDVSPARIKLSAAAHLITPSHIALDQADELARSHGERIGTTGRGIGPAYTDKAGRRGLRAELMREPERLGDRVAEHVQLVNKTLQHIYGKAPLDPANIAADYTDYARRLKPYLAETSLYLHQRLTEGAIVLAEGAQGTLLDVDLGTYPFVTSSSPGSGGAFSGLGISPHFAGRIIGVAKAFQTRVGEGPFPTEAFGAEAERLRGTGANPWDEFGTTTGRPRRCGWLDLVLLRYAVRVNGLTELVLTKLDVLSGLERVRLCTAYRPAGSNQTFGELPLGPADLSPFEPIYEDMAGWSEDLSWARCLEDLPVAARHYVQRIAELAGVPVTLVSVGPERAQIVRLDD